MHLAKRTCGYKYVLLDQENEPTYEELVEFRDYGVGIMDRCLVIGLEYAAENSKLWKIVQCNILFWIFCDSVSFALIS